MDENKHILNFSIKLMHKTSKAMREWALLNEIRNVSLINDTKFRTNCYCKLTLSSVKSQKLKSGKGIASLKEKTNGRISSELLE